MQEGYVGGWPTALQLCLAQSCKGLRSQPAHTHRDVILPSAGIQTNKQNGSHKQLTAGTSLKAKPGLSQQVTPQRRASLSTRTEPKGCWTAGLQLQGGDQSHSSSSELVITPSNTTNATEKCSWPRKFKHVYNFIHIYQCAHV